MFRCPLYQRVIGFKRFSNLWGVQDLFTFSAFLILPLGIAVTDEMELKISSESNSFKQNLCYYLRTLG